MNFLDKILLEKKEEVRNLKQKFTISLFKNEKYFENKTISLFNALKRNNKISLIAEIKKASPSKGILINNFNHIDIAKSYMSCSVEAISILTDRKFFNGDINYLKDIAQFKTVPLLRKDFIIDEIQIYEAKAFGADAILLIAEILSKNQIQELTSVAHECGLEVLLEFHSPSQLDKIDFNKNKIIGINNRNLESFHTDIKTTIQLTKYLPDDVIKVSESGINTDDDITKLKQANVDAVLIGEHFMKSHNLEKSINDFQKQLYI
ncbi:indole-3-glycerol phosphate synthase TrpC [Rosettibacter firmus]|uniref:indole-3-glycerol phosphate synthase TrpC n=1 Tax=Rosettibacter firmus TaxID=3111522 RepID=UPI00336BE58E